MEAPVAILMDDDIELCRRGDTRAYHTVYKKYAKGMLNSSFRILNNLADAEDMVQDAFVDAFKKLDTYTYKSPFEAWLRRIVINKSISHLRKKKGYWTDIDSVQLGDQADDGRIDEELFDMKIDQVKKAIARLPENYRIVFNLYAVDGVPQEEIGNILGIAHNNVRIQYHRAKKKILELLNVAHEN